MLRKKYLVLLGYAFIGWVLCFAAMGICMAILSMDYALIVHAIAAPFLLGGVAWVYFSRFNHTTPLQGALTFVGFIIIADFFIVALLINRSLEMFASLLGTWIPFSLIFISTYLVGTFRNRSRAATTAF